MTKHVWPITFQCALQDLVATLLRYWILLFFFIPNLAMAHYLGIRAVSAGNYTLAGIDGTIDILPSDLDYTLSVDGTLEFDSLSMKSDPVPTDRYSRQRRSAAMDFGWGNELTVNHNVNYGATPAEAYSNYGLGLSLSIVVKDAASATRAKKILRDCSLPKKRKNAKRVAPSEASSEVDCSIKAFVPRARFTLGSEVNKHLDKAEQMSNAIIETMVSATFKWNVSRAWFLKAGIKQYFFSHDIRAFLDSYDLTRAADAPLSTYENYHGFAYALMHRTFYGSFGYSPVTSVELEARITNKYRAWDSSHYNAGKLQVTYFFTPQYSASITVDQNIYPSKENRSYTLVVALSN